MSVVVDKVTKLYGQQLALDEVSLEARPGSIVGLLGPNGAGKSTLMKIITCFIPPDGGHVTVYGHSIFNESMEVRRRIGYLPESNPLYNDMYVPEYLRFQAGIHRIANPAARVRDMIGITGLGAEKHKKIGMLSKGYRQRVGLAQALIHDPEVLILDEPTSGLDPNQLMEIRQLIRESGREKTVILSTHIMQEVEAICDRVVIINKGKVVADDTASNLSVMAGGNPVLAAEFNTEVDAGKLIGISHVIRVERIAGNIYHLTVESGHDIRQDVFDFAVSNQLKVLSMKTLEQGLQDVFHVLTTKQ